MGQTDTFAIVLLSVCTLTVIIIIGYKIPEGKDVLEVQKRETPTTANQLQGNSCKPIIEKWSRDRNFRGSKFPPRHPLKVQKAIEANFGCPSVEHRDHRDVSG